MTPDNDTQRTDLAEIQKLTVAELDGRLDGMSRDDLEALRALEVANGDRVTALSAIDARIAALDAPPEQPAARLAKSGTKPAKDTPDWQKPDYTGKLDGGQAEWRRHNIKPAHVVGSK